MGWQIDLTGDVAAFDAAAGVWLRSEPVLHTLPLTVTDRLARGGSYGDEPAWLGWYADEAGKVCAVCIRTPPHPLIVTAMPDAAVDTLLAELPQVIGLNGPAKTVGRLTADWVARTGGTWQQHASLSLYALDKLTLPRWPVGSPRPADESDVPWLADWFMEFSREIGEPIEFKRAEANVRDRLLGGGITVWAVSDRPMSIAAISAPVAGAARIGPVYTPAAGRRRGYAGAVTAVMSQVAMDAGVGEVLLFADDDNPTSNGVYQRIGFRQVAPYTRVTFLT